MRTIRWEQLVTLVTGRTAKTRLIDWLTTARRPFQASQRRLDYVTGDCPAPRRQDARTHHRFHRGYLL
ncbi:hypothetical protein Smlt0069 [Stenotrophomonas maltophilia K279a]|uniref:Uncharacterized protein n=1 Tax=Stenotrophomonas maltophilia (strain K279a) TaxID=522373 RepID=B2FU32_STRMK|nr:hypothetical protein Smlt0069 [Stenotrophomonas maltophilia K279a]